MYGMFLGIYLGSFYRYKVFFVFWSWGGLKGGKFLFLKYYVMLENVYVESGIEMYL